MINYKFIACNEKLQTFEETLEDEQMKSYNELLKLGLTDEQIKIRGIDLSNVDKDEKIFYIMLPDELLNSPLEIHEDYKNAYARYLTDKKFIYKVEGVEKSIIIFAAYIGKYATLWSELELWQVEEDDYLMDPLNISHSIIDIRQLTMDQLEQFYESNTPQKLTIIKR